MPVEPSQTLDILGVPYLLDMGGGMDGCGFAKCIFAFITFHKLLLREAAIVGKRLDKSIKINIPVSTAVKLLTFKHIFITFSLCFASGFCIIHTLSLFLSCFFLLCILSDSWIYSLLLCESFESLWLETFPVDYEQGITFHSLFQYHKWLTTFLFLLLTPWTYWTNYLKSGCINEELKQMLQFEISSFEYI